LQEINRRDLEKIWRGHLPWVAQTDTIDFIAIRWTSFFEMEAAKAEAPEKESATELPVPALEAIRKSPSGR
jgi:hypothetical protein